MAESLLVGGAVGAGMQELLKAGLKVIDKGRKFRPTLETSTETLQALTPLLEQIKQRSDELDRPREELQRLENEINAGKKLVAKCSKMPWWRSISFPLYQDKLQKRDKKLARHMSMELPAVMARDLMETLLNVKRIFEILSNGGGGLVRCQCEPPKEPEFTLGLDEPLKTVRAELIKKGGGVPVILLTGLGGSGKSTLAKKLCWDDQVKGMFGENIFFVTISKMPTLKSIVQILFEHCRQRVPEFQSDEDAINRLGTLLSQVGNGGRPILLVLDDVWPGFEAHIEKFKFQISDYKIMVTSRVAFPRFSFQYHMKPLDHEDAISLFRYFAQPNNDNLVQEMVRGCKGSPLALKVIGGSLCQQPFEVWQNMKELQSIIFETNTDLLAPLQNSLDILEEIKEKECFMDLGLFPEDQRIRVAALIDMWTELHELGDDDINAMNIIHSLTTKNMANIIITRKIPMDADMYYNHYFLIQHDLLRELAIHRSNQEGPFEQRKRLMVDLSGNNHPDWWIEQNHQKGIISRMLSFFPKSWIQPKQKVAARTLSISTDETSDSDWCNVQPDETEVLVLNIQSSKYTMPAFAAKMRKLKVLIATNYGFHPSELNKFELLAYLPDLKRIRLEKMSVPRLCKLTNLRKLSLHMCNTRQIFESSPVKISHALPNLEEMTIDYCKDLVQLPYDFCNVTTMKKLSITNCHNFSALPLEIGNLHDLEVLRLCCCSDLEEMPDSVQRLHKLHCLDISGCINLTQLPTDIGDLQSLQKLYMSGCSRLSELPYSFMNFEGLKHEIRVVCDEELFALWEHFTVIPNLKIEMSKADISLNWLDGVHS